MSSIIRVLSEDAINQIAAGEVIENPASVVKELMENAIDAGAVMIKVETTGGGQQLIRIVDNGCGMVRDDALLCLERYATSKIRKAQDLFELTSMGFRGEALASIAAISKLTLTTAPAVGEGTRVEVEAGKILKVEPCARRAGTTIEVRSLFFNVPARKKFQKSASINAAEITKVVSQLALAHPKVGFELAHQEKQVFSMPPIADIPFDAMLLLRAGQVLGEEFISSIFTIDIEGYPCRIQGFVAAPALSRNNRTGQYLFINQRPVVCPLISFAVKDGYGTRIEPNRHPAYVLHLSIPQQFVDVNVHPQKKEVRLREERLFKDKIQEAVSLSLQKNERSGIGCVSDVEPLSFSAKHFSFLSEEKPLENRFTSSLSFKEEGPQKEIEFAFQEEPRTIGIFSNYILIEAASVKAHLSLDNPFGSLDGILLMDLQAARARLMFEAFIDKTRLSFQKQGLFLPLTLNLAAADAEVIEDCLEDIEKIGIEMRKLSHHAFIVEALPSFMEVSDVPMLLDKIAEDLHCVSWVKELHNQKLRALASIASRFAKAHKKIFMLQEGIAIFEQLLRTASPYSCPQGKPTLVHINHDEIKKYFAQKKK
jgi:DNA mismatch repair protein MutL